jgi:hypothetical protein
MPETIVGSVPARGPNQWPTASRVSGQVTGSPGDSGWVTRTTASSPVARTPGVAPSVLSATVPSAARSENPSVR